MRSTLVAALILALTACGRPTAPKCPDVKPDTTIQRAGAAVLGQVPLVCVYVSK